MPETGLPEEVVRLDAPHPSVAGNRVSTRRVELMEPRGELAQRKERRSRNPHDLVLVRLPNIEQVEGLPGGSTLVELLDRQGRQTRCIHMGFVPSNAAECLVV